MKVLSVNVGQPRFVAYRGKQVATAIYKEPVTGTVEVGAENLAGDRQADLRVHGGYSKAVYVYPAEHYAFWRAELPEMELPYGMFGENLTVEGWLETEARVGDRIRIGTAEFIVTEPRQPCFKLGIKFGRKDILKRFAQSGRSGFYLAIAKTGKLAADDAVELINRNHQQPTIAELTNEKFDL